MIWNQYVMSFLIVDGNLHRQRQLKSVLASLGYKTTSIECVADPRTALAMLKKKRVDCCFVAISGERAELESFLSEVRDSLSVKALGIIVFAPGATKEDVFSAIRAGANSFLAYPFSPRDVEEVLKHVQDR
jgi:CheY-like chemotaxis protein